MRRHVVRTFGGVTEPGGILRDEAFEIFTHVAEYIGICIFLDGKGSRSVLDKYGENAAGNLLAGHPVSCGARDIVETFTACGYLEVSMGLFQWPYGTKCVEPKG